MEETSREQLYHLLPSIYRLRDKAQGEPLRALMNTLESELRLVEEDIDALYDNWFIETCDEWTLPYLAGHVGVYNPDEVGKLFPTQRRQIANTIGYRRRKGLKAVLEHALEDVTGWYIHCVEYDQLLAHTQHLTDVIGTRGRSVDLHLTDELATLNGPFEATAHTIDVRNIARVNTGDTPDRALQGRYNPGNLGVFVWRLQSYPLSMVPARAVTRSGEHTPAPGCFTFDPLGRDMPLYNLPQAVDLLTSSVEPVHLPIPLSRFDLARDIEDYCSQQHIPSEESPFEEEDPLHNSIYYGPDRALCVLLDGAPLLPDAILSADLSKWNLPPASTWRRTSRVAIDVVLGRLRFLDASLLKASDTVAVNYCYAFSADLGGGPYTRFSSTSAGTRYRLNVLQGGKIGTLQQALSAWDDYCHTWEQQHPNKGQPQVDRPRGTIQIVDSGWYAENELTINLPKNGDLVITTSNGVRPVIEGDLRIRSAHGSAYLQLNGLLVHGKVLVDGDLDVAIEHCTLMPYGLETGPSSRSVQIAIEHSIVGPVHLPNHAGTLTINDSIVDRAAGNAIVALYPEGKHGSTVSLERVTIFGKVQARELRLAVNVLFTGPVEIQDREHGLVSFSYVPAHSQTPRQEHCLSPSTEPTNSGEQSVDTQDRPESISPLFTSTRYGNAAYAQLDARCSSLIQRGADNGAEMGVFNSLRRAQRQDNLAHTLDEYLPFGLEAGVFYMT